MFNSFGNGKVKKQLKLRVIVAQGRRCSGADEVSPIKNVDGYFFSGATLMLRGMARKKRTSLRPFNMQVF